MLNVACHSCVSLVVANKYGNNYTNISLTNLQPQKSIRVLNDLL